MCKSVLQDPVKSLLHIVPFQKLFLYCLSHLPSKLAQKLSIIMCILYVSIDLGAEGEVEMKNTLPRLRELSTY